MMTREDMLRELELLPVWQLREPLPVIDAVESAVEVSVDLAIQPSTFTESPSIEVEPPPVEPIALLSLTAMMSEDQQWLFVMSEAMLSDDESQLLSQIFKAMRLQMLPAAKLQNIDDALKNSTHKVLVTLGEPATQQLLQSPLSWASVRGVIHQFGTLKLVPTYDLNHLIRHPHDKALAWKDLCLAMQQLVD